ncbi:MAG TPA: insulinase family protein, partial [Isosphaeraceae bacterium]|nr:insulinase family protein [Isosphaeraceae bacterium]
MTATRRTTLVTGGALAAIALAATVARGAEGEKAPQAGHPAAVYLPARSTPLVALRFVLRVGSQDDPKG